MTLRIETGWDHDVIGTASIYVTEATGPLSFTASVTTGKVCHTDISSVMGTGNYDTFAAALKAALDAASAAARDPAAGWTYTVTWTGSTGSYAISAAEGNTALDFSTPGAPGTVARHILGFSANSGSAASHASDVAPYYYISAAVGGRCNATDDYEPDGVVEGAESDDGTQYSVSRTTAAVYSDFDLTAEAKAAVFTRSLVAAVPWTYQHMWQHVRSAEPFLVVDDVESSVMHLRPDGASWKPGRMVPNFDGLWSIAFRTIVAGRL